MSNNSKRNVLPILADTWATHFLGRPPHAADHKTREYVAAGAAAMWQALDLAGYSIRPKRGSPRGSGGAPAVAA